MSVSLQDMVDDCQSVYSFMLTQSSFVEVDDRIKKRWCNYSDIVDRNVYQGKKLSRGGIAHFNTVKKILHLAMFAIQHNVSVDNPVPYFELVFKATPHYRDMQKIIIEYQKYEVRAAMATLAKARKQLDRYLEG